MNKDQTAKKTSDTNEQETGKADPSIRQEFPGVAKSEENLKAGKRNTGTTGDKKVKPENDVPETDGAELNE